MKCAVGPHLSLWFLCPPDPGMVWRRWRDDHSLCRTFRHTPHPHCKCYRGCMAGKPRVCVHRWLSHQYKVILTTISCYILWIQCWDDITDCCQLYSGRWSGSWWCFHFYHLRECGCLQTFVYVHIWAEWPWVAHFNTREPPPPPSSPVLGDVTVLLLTVKITAIKRWLYVEPEKSDSLESFQK